MTRTALLALAVVALAACPEPPPETPALEPLDDTAYLVRVSMALRGVRPSLDDIRKVQADPGAIEALVDEYMQTPEFAATIREMHGEQFLLGVDPIIFPAGFPALGALAGKETQSLNLDIIDAPLRLVEHVVMEDRPYHEIVTADYTMTNATTSAVWGIPYDASGPEWQEQSYTDGREVAGLLSDGYIYTRHSSTPSNMNRGRASFTANAFLCYDFLSRSVELDTNIDLSDEEAVKNAIANNTACQSCHQTLDPLAAHFASHYVIYVPGFLTDYPFPFMQNPLRGLMRPAEPAFFGTPTRGLRDLGVLMASDPRFSMCTARRFVSWFTEEDRDAVPVEVVSKYNDIFLSEAMNAKALVRAIVLSEEFRAGAASTDEGAETLRGIKTARPEQIARLFSDLTGYRWETDLPFDITGIGNIGRVDLMTDALFGYATLAGGTDSQTVPRPAGTTSATSTLVMEQLAAYSAASVVRSDFAESDKAQRRLLTQVDEDEDGEDIVRAQLQDLSLRLHGEDLDKNDPAIDDAFALWSAVASDEDPRRAWELTLYAMLRDIRVVSY